MDGRSARAALILAAETIATGGLRATAPFLGATLVEHQVRQAVAAGAAHVVVLVATMPADLLAALDRLRRAGLGVEVARSLADAADRLHPQEQVLLIADGCLAPQPLVARIASGAVTALLVQPAGTGDFERLDAAHGWAGLASVDGALVRLVATMPGDWDAQSVLVRRAVQAGAARIDAGETVPRLLGEGGIAPIDPAMLAESRAPGGAWPRRWLYPLVEGPALRLIAPRAAMPHWLGLGAIALAGLGLALAVAGLPGAGLAAWLVAGPAWSTGRRLARLRLARWGLPLWADLARPAMGAAGLLVVAVRIGDWGWTLLGALTMLAMAAAAREAAMLGARGQAVPAFVADADAIGWAALAGFAAAGWPGAVGVAAGYALASFAAVQDRLARGSR